MALMLPSTIEELNLSQGLAELSPTFYDNSYEQDFENIPTEKRFKREYSLPQGLPEWNIGSFETYLNFKDTGGLKVNKNLEDSCVPSEADFRQRCESYSSVASSSMDEKSQLLVPNYGVKTFNTVRMDSGSTCISSEHTYAHQSVPIFNGLDMEETYQNLDVFLHQVPDMNLTDSLSDIPPVSPLSSNGSNFELSSINSFNYDNSNTDSVFERLTCGAKRPAEELIDDEVFVSKVARTETAPPPYSDKKKSNVSSKNGRKTRKEKQKDMEARVTDLEKEREELNVEVKLLEELINAHKMQLFAILKNR